MQCLELHKKCGLLGLAAEASVVSTRVDIFWCVS